MIIGCRFGIQFFGISRRNNDLNVLDMNILVQNLLIGHMNGD